MKAQLRLCNLLVAIVLLSSAWFGGGAPSPAIAAPTTAAFTPGNIVIYRVGDGNTNLVNTGNPVFLDEYTPSGTLVQSIPMPTAASGSNRQLIAGGTAASEGLLTRSVDGQYLLLTGYATATGGSTLSSTTGTAVPRTVGRVDYNGNVDTSTALTDFASGNTPRSAVSTNGTDLWVSGGAGGVRYASLGNSTSTDLTSSVMANVRQMNIYNNQLFASSGSGTNTFRGVETIGTGLPTSGSQTVTRLPGLSDSLDPSDYAFFLADLDSGVAGMDTLYIVDDNTSTGGIYKFSLVAGSWVKNGTAGTAADLYRGLTGVVSGSTVTLFATRKGNYSATVGGELVKLTDPSGYNGDFSGTPDVLAAATSKTAFRGVALVPDNLTPMADLTVSLSAPAAVAAGTGFDYTLTASNRGSADVSGVTVQFTLPGGLTYASSAGSGFSGSETGGVVTFTGSLAAGAAASLTVSVSAAPAGTYTAATGAAVIQSTTPITESNPYNNASGQAVNTVVETRPAVSSTTPSDGASNIATGSPLTIQFNKSVAVTSGWFTLTDTTHSATLAATVAETSPSQTYTLTATGGLPKSSHIQVTVNSSHVATANGLGMGSDTSFAFDTWDAAPLPNVSTTTPANGATHVALGANLTIDFNLPVTVSTTPWFTISCGTSGSHSATWTPAGNPTAASSFTLDPEVDFSLAETCTVTVLKDQVTNADSAPMAANYTFSFTMTPDGCTPPAADYPLTAITEVQGSGASTPLANQKVTVKGTVTDKVLAAKPNGWGGFFIQDNSSTIPNASSGLFISASSLSTSFNVGDPIQVSGVAKESYELTELDSVTNFQVCQTGATITPTALTLPMASMADFERYENMLVTFSQTLTVTDTYKTGTYGEVVLSAPGFQFNPNNFTLQSHDGTINTDNQKARFILDDGKDGLIVGPSTIPYLQGTAPDKTLRVGATTSSVTGVLHYEFDAYRIQPTAAVTFDASAAPRPATPPAVGGTIKAAGFNVYNYFTTLKSQDPNARGANDATEFARQQTKLVEALYGLNADVIGLTEIENNGPTALTSLVTALNTKIGANEYSFVVDPGGNDKFGTDAIKVAILYKPSKVNLVGASVTSSNSIFDRPPLAQTFQDAAGHKFTLIVNHFKSKGSCSMDASDKDDGQGACNHRRISQAQATLAFINELTTATGDNHFLLVGDYNAYGVEDPITTLTTGGLVNEVAKNVQQEDRYSYSYGGEMGYLDHALASASLDQDYLTGTGIWHINSSEPPTLNFYTTNLSSGTYYQKGEDLYTASPWHSSDHDPVINGLNLTLNQAPTLDHAIPDQKAAKGWGFKFAFAANTFGDDYAWQQQALQYTATLADGSPLPAGISFDAATRTFSGAPAAAGTFSIKVTATDPFGASTSTTFNLIVGYQVGLPFAFR